MLCYIMFLTNDGIRKNPWVFFFLTFPPTTNNDANNHIYYRTLTSLRAGIDYV